MDVTYSRLIISLGEGRHTCPSCGGNNSLSVAKISGRLMWHCFRASCTLKGIHDLSMNVSDLEDVLKPKMAATMPDIILPDEWAPITVRDEFVPEKWVDNLTPAFDACKFRMYANRSDMRIVFQSLDDVYISKAVDHRVPKVLNVRNSNKGFLIHKDYSLLVLVEDVLSCSNVYPLASSLALLGTTLTDAQLELVLRYKTVLISLDPDARIKGLHMAKDLAVHVDAYAINAPNDLKYMSREAINKLIQKEN